MKAEESCTWIVYECTPVVMASYTYYYPHHEIMDNAQGKTYPKWLLSIREHAISFEITVSERPFRHLVTSDA